MFPLPDVATLRLCSVLASSAFALVFAVLWIARRSEVHWGVWAASSALYAGVILSFQHATHAALEGVLYACLAATDFLILWGLLCFEGRRGRFSWMAVASATTGLAYAAPMLVGGPELGWLSRAAGTTGLAACMGVVGLILTFGRGARGSCGRRIAGGALLGYLPGYALVVASEFSGIAAPDIAAAIPMLSDQLLLGLLNLGLLAMPGERAQAALRATAWRDPLTGALNRAGLDAHAPGRPAPNLAIIVIDVDRFKAINDRYGHSEGDAVLVALVERATALLPGARDVVARLGGDEFAVLLNGVSLAAAREVAEGIRIAMSDRRGRPSSTVSLGVAQAQADDVGLAAVIARADAALYRAKLAGRDRAAA